MPAIEIPTSAQPAPPDFRSREFLLDHALRTMTFYHPHASTRPAASSTSSRTTARSTTAATRHLGQQHALRLQLRDGVRASSATRRVPRAARHGFDYLREVHRDPHTGGYAWTIDGRRRSRMTAPTTATAWPSCCSPTRMRVEAGIDEAARVDRRNLGPDGARFWDADAGLYARRSRRPTGSCQRLPRPEREHAHVRGDAGGVRGERRRALSGSRAHCSPTT